MFENILLTVAWFIFASLVANNLFVAVIIENFEVGNFLECSKPSPGVRSLCSTRLEIILECSKIFC